MGRYVEFWKGYPDGITGHFLSLIDEFREWYEDFLTGPYADEAIQDVFELISRVQVDSAELKVKDLHHAVIVDQMISEFYGSFLDSAPNHDKLSSIKTSVLRVQRYAGWLPWIIENAGKAIGKYWRFIIEGRGVGRIADEIPFNSIDECFLVAFWTIDECIAFKKALSGLKLPSSNGDPDGDIPYIVKDVLVQATDAHHGLIITVA